MVVRCGEDLAACALPRCIHIALRQSLSYVILGRSIEKLVDMLILLDEVLTR